MSGGGGLFREFLEGGGGLTKSPPLGAERPQSSGAFGEFLTGADERARLRVSVDAAAAKQPDREARVVRLQTKTGLPADVIDRNLEAVEAEAARADFDPDTFRRTNPVLARWMENPTNAAVARDDLANLRGWEWLLRAPRAAFREGQGTVEAGQIGYRQLLGQATAEDLRRADELEAASGRDYGADGFFGKALVEASRILPTTLQGLAGGLQGGTAGAIGAGSAAALAGQLGPQVALPEEAITVPAASAIGFAVGSRAGAMQSAFELESGLAFREYRKSGIDEGAARVAAVAAGAVNAGLETLALGTLVKTIPGGDRVLAGLTRGNIGALMRKPTVRQAFTNLAGRYAGAWSTEVLTEVAQEAVTILAGAVAGGESPTNAVFGEEGRARLTDTFVQTARAMTLMAAPGPVASFAGDYRRAVRATRQQQAIAALGSAAESSKLRGRLPEKFREYVEQVATEGGVENVYVPVEEFARVFNQSGRDAEAAARELTGDVTQFREALATGGDLVVPLADFATKIAGTPDFEALAPHVRLNQGDMTQAESEAWMRDAAAEFERMTAEVGAVAGEQGQRSASDQQVYDDVREQLVAAGVEEQAADYQAKLTQAVFRTLGARTGQDAWSLYSERGLQIVGPLQATAGLEAANPIAAADPVAGGRNALGLFTAARTERGALRSPGSVSTVALVDEWARLSQALDTEQAEFEAVSNDPRFTQMLELPDTERTGGGREDMPDADGQMDPDEVQRMRATVSGFRRRTAVRNQQRKTLARLEAELQRRGIDPVDVLARRSAAESFDPSALDEADRVLMQSAFHGTPFRGIEKFSTEKIGTGEGAQAFGWGLYFTESKDVAEWYRNKLKRGALQFGDEVVSLADNSPTRWAAQAIAERSRLYPNAPAMVGESAKGFLRGRTAWLQPFEIEQAVGEVDRLMSLGFRGEVPAVGQLYEVELAPEADEYILWDKPFAEQSDKVKAALDVVRSDLSNADVLDTYEEQLNEDFDRWTVRDLIKLALPRAVMDDALRLDENGIRHAENGNDPAAVSSYLHSLGIRGVKYLDGTSRKKGEGAFNFVIFSEDDVAVQRTFYQSSLRQMPDGAVLFHGTSAPEFGSFQPGRAVYLTNDPREAWAYATDDIIGGGRGKGERRVLEVTVPAGAIRDVSADLDRWIADDGDPSEFLDAAVEQASRDGIPYLHFMHPSYHSEEGEMHAYVAVSPETIDIYDDIPADIPEDNLVYPASPAWGFESQPPLRQGGDAPRGYIQFGNARTTIGLLERADLSTFLHETGHLYLEVLADLAEADGAPQQVVDDWQRVLGFLGVGDRSEIGVDQHEQWARAFEGYLLEGKAPAAELVGPFARFRAWLVALYRNLRSLNVELTPEIRGVFDRLVATDDEIRAAEAGAEYRPVFDTAEEAGATEAEFAAYQRRATTATEEARDALFRRLLEERTKETREFWKAARAGVREDVEAEILGEPIVQAARYLIRGELPGGDVVTEKVKLSREVLATRYGEDAWKSLPRGTTAKAGVDPDVVASLFGLPSGDALITGLQGYVPENQRIEAETDRRMRELYPDLVNDSPALADAAADAVHSDARANVLLTALRLLGRQTAMRPVGELAAIKAEVRRQIAGKRFRDVQPFGYQQAEAKAGRLAYEAAKSGDMEQAVRFKRQQLLNHLLWRESRDAKAEADKAVTYLAGFAKPAARARLGKAGADYLAQVDALLARFRFSRSVSVRRADSLESLAAFIQRQEAQGLQVEIADDLRDEAFQTDYRNLTVEQILGLRDGVKNIAHLAKLKNTLLAAQADRAFDEVVNDIVGGIEAHHAVADLKPDFAPTKFKRFVERLREFDARHVRPEFLFRWLDGEQANGPVWSALFKPIADAEARENAMMRDAHARMTAIFDQIPAADRRTWFTRKIPVAGVGTFTRATMLSVALNWGNAGNREALMQGYGWTESEVQAILAQLTAAEWDMVQQVWDFVDSYWPAISDLQQKMTGLPPAKVERAGFTVRTADGVERTLPGGYYPLRYDGAQSFLAFKREENANVNDLFGGNFLKPATKKGHTIERVGSGGQPVKLDLGVLTEHVTNVIHDLTHRAAVIDADRLLSTERVRLAIEGTAGRQMYRMLRPWLQQIANDYRQPAGGLEAIIGRARTGATVVNMGWKVTTALTQILGFTQTINELGAAYTARGLAAVFGGPAAMKRSVETALAKSAALRDRQQSFDREIRDIAKVTAAGSPRAVSKVQESFFYFTGLMDMAVAVPTWWGGYLKAIEGKVDGVAAGDESAAVAFADAAVRLSQGSGSAKDLANIQTGSQYHRAFTMFYSYFNVLYNLFRRSGSTLAREGTKGVPRFAASMLFLWIAPAVLGELLAGRGPGDDDEPEAWALRKIASYPFGSVVLLRDIVNGMGDFGYEMSPVADAFKVLARLGATAGDVMTGDAELDRGDLRDVLTAVGYWAALPTRQIWITGEGLYDWMTGEDVPDSAGDAAKQLMFTRPPQDR